MKTRLLFLMLCFTGILFAQTGVPSGAPTADLLAYYPFESNPNNVAGTDYNLVVISDDTPNQNWTSVGYMENGAVGGYIDIQRYAGLIDSNTDYLTYFNSATNPEFTLSFFMKQGLSVDNSVPMFGTFIEMFESFFFRGSGGVYGISTLDGDFPFGNLQDFFLSNVWKHYAITFKENPDDATEGLLSVYIDGVFVESIATPTFNIEKYSDNLSIGTGYSGENLNWSQKGVALGIDELYIYGRALTSSEIEDLYTLNELPDCPTGNVTLTSQAEVDAFVADYPNCTEIEGNLTIGNSVNSNITDITDISGLNNLESVVGFFRIVRTSLTTLPDFANLTSAESVTIEVNPQITSLAGFNNLTESNGILFSDNALLTSISGFNSVESLNALQIIDGQPVLTDVIGFTNLETVTGMLNIGAQQLNQINNISGLSNLQSVGLLYVRGTQLADLNALNGLTLEGPDASGSRLEFSNNFSLTSLPSLNFDGPTRETIIFNNPLLTDLSGLENLTKSNLTIHNNTGLTSLSGLEGLEEANKWVPNATFAIRIMDNADLSNIDALSNYVDADAMNVQITNNGNLSDITGLNNLAASTVNQVNISGNGNLATCDSALLCEYIFLNDDQGLTLVNNGANCSSVEDVEANCATVLDGLCPNGNLFYTQESQIIRYGEFYVNCTELENLTVAMPDNTDLSMFDPLISANSLRLINVNGTSMNGFPNVQALNFLTIEGSSNLETLNILGNLQGEVNRFEMFNNPELTTVNNLGTFDVNYLEIRGNNSLTDLSFLSNANFVPGEYFAFGFNGNTTEFRAPYLQITNNHSLTSLNDLTIPSEVYSLFIAGNSLEDLSALSTIESIAYGLYLYNIEEIEDVDFLSNLTSFTVGEMYIHNNQNVENLDGLNNVIGNLDHASYIEISENPNLATCENSFICALVDEFEEAGGGGDFLLEDENVIVQSSSILYIYDNATGCDSVEEIEIACETFSTEIFLTSDVSIYPNPFTNQLNIQLPAFVGNAKVSLVDINGKVLFQQDMNEIGQITGLDQLAKGLYFVQILSEDGQKVTHKIIK
ncbi:MAG: T9SS type A sorting domain-containing protein [Flavobacteriaceae bacterium]|nr:T9SS type A sorting domain-containing protein [Flavobacteriaceae bacterium]